MSGLASSSVPWVLRTELRRSRCPWNGVLVS